MTQELPEGTVTILFTDVVGSTLLSNTRGDLAAQEIMRAQRGLWKEAEEHFQQAMRQADELPHKLDQPEVRRWYARMLLDRDAPGDSDEARQLLREAVAMYREIGMPKHVEMAEALLSQT